jgi:hypothetical protein
MKKQHTIAFIKRQASKLKKERGISHHEALEQVSKAYGYANWMHCLRSIEQQQAKNVRMVEKSADLSFSAWLKRQVNRNSPLGDLAGDFSRDKTWPAYNTQEQLLSYLRVRGASYIAIETFVKAWKTYQRYVSPSKKPKVVRAKIAKTKTTTRDPRKIVYVRDAVPIPYRQRSTEKFVPGDQAWISWDGRKAVPVTITEVDERHYTFIVERPAIKAGDGHYLLLDEVRSTPELACQNYVTF